MRYHKIARIKKGSNTYWRAYGHTHIQHSHVYVIDTHAHISSKRALKHIRTRTIVHAFTFAQLSYERIQSNCKLSTWSIRSWKVMLLTTWGVNHFYYGQLIIRYNWAVKSRVKSVITDFPVFLNVYLIYNINHLNIKFLVSGDYIHFEIWRENSFVGIIIN